MRQAVVLVGGRGTRLGTLAQATPKPLLPIDGDRRFLDYLIENLARHGLQQVILLAGHLAQQVEDRYAGRRIGDCEIVAVREPSPAGTAGALRHAKDLLDPVFLMMNGDSFFDFNVLALGEALKPGDLGALALRKIDDARRYGVVQYAEGRVLRFLEKDASLNGPAWISAGVYILRRTVLDRVGPGPWSLEIDVFPPAAAEGRLGCAAFQGYFIDIGLPETLDQGRRELPAIRRRPAVFFGAGASPRSEDDTIIGPPGAASAIRAVNDAGWLAIAVNASGDAEGQARIQSNLRANGAHIDAFQPGPNPSETLVRWPIDSAPSIMISHDPVELAAAERGGLAGVRLSTTDVFKVVEAWLAVKAGRESPAR